MPLFRHVQGSVSVLLTQQPPAKVAFSLSVPMAYDLHHRSLNPVPPTQFKHIADVSGCHGEAMADRVQVYCVRLGFRVRG